MPRLRRYYQSGLSVHVIQRGNNRMAIFGDDHDRRRYLELVERATTACCVQVHAFVLMNNHVHLLVTPGDQDALPKTMHRLDGGYSSYFNRRYGRIGTLWNGRYRGLVIGDETYWLTCLRYIEQNPVRAHMVDDPGKHEWSSYRSHAIGEENRLLVPHQLYEGLGSTPAGRQAAYRAICGVRLDETELTLQRRPPSAKNEGGDM